MTSGDSTSSRKPIAQRAQRFVPRSVRRSTRGFSLVLVLLVTIYVVAEVSNEGDVAISIVWLLAFLSAIVTLRALHTAPRTVYINLSVMAAVLLLSVIGLVIEQEALIWPAGAAVSIYSFIAPVLILRYVLRRHRITTDVIFGALAVYVFLGINFAVVYDIIAGLDADAFATPGGAPTSLFYFSYMTLTTVGYGDITPVSDLARALAVVEALAGQILLIVIVARLVGMQIAQRRPEEL